MPPPHPHIRNLKDKGKKNIKINGGKTKMEKGVKQTKKKE